MTITLQETNIALKNIFICFWGKEEELEICLSLNPTIFNIQVPHALLGALLLYSKTLFFTLRVNINFPFPTYWHKSFPYFVISSTIPNKLTCINRNYKFYQGVESIGIQEYERAQINSLQEHLLRGTSL